jgi:cell wall-associated NlpC family hydrolase
MTDHADYFEIDPLWVADYLVGKGRDLERDERMMPSDLLYWAGEPGHVGIYAGAWRYIHAPKKKQRVKIGSLLDG